jgi:hypothetical protein
MFKVQIEALGRLAILAASLRWQVSGEWSNY